MRWHEQVAEPPRHARGGRYMSDAVLPGALPAQQGALALDTFELTKRFGSFTALDRVSLKVAPGSVHALLGENGAGKSTLVKCVVGYQRAEEGSVLIDGREHDIASPVVAREFGIGMVYQHFTLVPGMTVAENLLLDRKSTRLNSSHLGISYAVF